MKIGAFAPRTNYSKRANELMSRIKTCPHMFPGTIGAVRRRSEAEGLRGRGGEKGSRFRAAAPRRPVGAASQRPRPGQEIGSPLRQIGDCP